MSKREYAVLNQEGEVIEIPPHLHGYKLLEWSNDYIPQGIIWSRVIGEKDEILKSQGSKTQSRKTKTKGKQNKRRKSTNELDNQTQ